MDKKDKTYFAIFDEYLEEVPNKEGCYYITDDVLTKFVYQMRHLEYMKEFSDKRVKNLNKKVKHYYTLVHVYKVELGRCRRKLTRIYKRLFNHFYCDFGDVEGAKSYVDYWRKHV